MSNRMKSIKAALTRFEKAVRKDEMSGSLSHIEAIEAEIDYRHKRKALEEFIEKLLETNDGSNARSESEGIRQETDED